MEKKTKTLKQWQKIYPDAIRIKADAGTFLSNEYLKKIVDGEGHAKVLQDTSWATWSSTKGTKVRVNAIVSKMAYEQEKQEQV